MRRATCLIGGCATRAKGIRRDELHPDIIKSKSRSFHGPLDDLAGGPLAPHLPPFSGHGMFQGHKAAPLAQGLQE